MEIQQLKIFRDLAYQKNFSKTAELNFLTQPSISLSLKRLEEELGVKLLHRVPRKVSLTKEGTKLLPPVEEILLRCENLKTLIAEMKKLQTGEVRIATIYSVGIYELAPALKKFMRRYPDIDVDLQYEHVNTIYELVQKGRVDLGVVAFPQPRASIHITPFTTDGLVLIVPPEHPLARRRAIRIKNILEEPFIAFEKGIPTRDAIDEALEKNGIQLKIRSTSENIDTLKKAVEVGLGISIVPQKTVIEETKKGSLRSLLISDLKLKRPIGILTRKDRLPSRAVSLFIEILLNKK